MIDSLVTETGFVESRAVTISAAHVDAIASQILASKTNLYAVLDVVDEPAAAERAVENEGRYHNLYSGFAKRDYWAISPYLVLMQQEDFDWIRANLESSPWGIFAESEAELSAVRQHFRKLLTVKDAQSGNHMLFRFYDPRVLPVFLESCSVEQARSFYGPITKFYFFSEPNTVWQAELAEAL